MAISLLLIQIRIRFCHRYSREQLVGSSIFMLGGPQFERTFRQNINKYLMGNSQFGWWSWMGRFTRANSQSDWCDVAGHSAIIRINSGLNSHISVESRMKRKIDYYGNKAREVLSPKHHAVLMVAFQMSLWMESSEWDCIGSYALCVLLYTFIYLCSQSLLWRFNQYATCILPQLCILPLARSRDIYPHLLCCSFFSLIVEVALLLMLWCLIVTSVTIAKINTNIHMYNIPIDIALLFVLGSIY